ncbi:hypothetical protein F2P81_006197 [Scophthalmus maximus]|uniref:Uncharacterized protein n=1 Tax=Scophthalmus maximus TaxID=52904 RepID=A0A6A4TBP1_SCOMX|nr:hypothetical protein F2P81_006197 [Scophthalmus maximus]
MEPSDEESGPMLTSGKVWETLHAQGQAIAEAEERISEVEARGAVTKEALHVSCGRTTQAEGKSDRSG